MKELDHHILTADEHAEINMAVKTELSRDATIETPGDMLFNISAFLETDSHDTLARLLKISRGEITNIINGSIDEKLKERVRMTFAYSSIMSRYDPERRVQILSTPIPKLGNRSPQKCLEDGDVDLVLLEAITQSENIEGEI